MMNGNYGWVWNILTLHLICTRLLYGDGVPCLDCKNLAWSQMYVQGQIPASAGYVIMDRALANWVHISNRNGLDDLHAIKLPESRPRNKTSALCQEVQSECPDAYAGDWRLSTWRSTPGLNSTLPRTFSASASRIQNVSRDPRQRCKPRVRDSTMNVGTYRTQCAVDEEKMRKAHCAKYFLLFALILFFSWEGGYTHLGERAHSCLLLAICLTSRMEPGTH